MLIQEIKVQIQVHWEIQVLVRDIENYIRLCNNVFITHIFRQWNYAADWLAKLGLSLHSTTTWIEVSHRNLLNILHEDNL